MRRLGLSILVCILLSGCAGGPPPLHKSDYAAGAVPQNYEQIIRDHLNAYLERPETLRDLEIKGPHEVVVPYNNPYAGLYEGESVWECIVTYQAQNRRDFWVGDLHVYWFKNDLLVAFDYKGPSLEYNIRQNIKKHHKQPAT